MRASRLLAILILLQLRQRLTAGALAAEFEVSERTIYRDIDALSAAGVPVYGDRGPGGGFQLLDGYRTRLTGLASDEAEALPMIGLPGPAAALGIGPAAARAQGKLLAALAQPALAGAGRMGARFHLDPVDWYRSDEPVRHLPALARAVLDERCVAIRYESWTATRDSTVDPLGLVLKAGAWYLIAAGGGKLRTYKVAKIQRLTIVDSGFERLANFDLATHWRESLARFETELRPRTATLRITARGRERLAELGAWAACAVAAADGDTITLPIESDAETARQLIGIGADLEVIEPASLRKALHTLAEQVAARHS